MEGRPAVDNVEEQNLSTGPQAKSHAFPSDVIGSKQRLENDVEVHTACDNDQSEKSGAGDGQIALPPNELVARNADDGEEDCPNIEEHAEQDDIAEEAIGVPADEFMLRRPGWVDLIPEGVQRLGGGEEERGEDDGVDDAQRESDVCRVFDESPPTVFHSKPVFPYTVHPAESRGDDIEEDRGEVALRSRQIPRSERLVINMVASLTWSDRLSSGSVRSYACLSYPNNEISSHLV